MNRISMWWLFFLIFGLMIGGIQSFGWWTRQASAQAQVSQPCSTPTNRNLQVCEPKHWRSIIMQQ